jgi:paraquat-inducible protein B
MNRNALLVGAFTVVAALLVVAAVLWLGGSNLLQRQHKVVMYFEGSISGLYVGAPVTFRGVPVGQVHSIGIELDGHSLQARIPVRARLQPDSVQYRDGQATNAGLDLRALVQRGLRARLVSQSYVTGQKVVDLDFLPDTPARLLGSGSEAEIPALPERFGNLMEQLARLPLGDTVQDLRDTLQALQRTLAHTQDTLNVAAQSLRQVSDDARRTQQAAVQAMQRLQASATGTLASMTRLADSARDTVLAAQPELQHTLAGTRAAAQDAQLAMQRVAELTAAGAPLRGDLEAAVRDLAQAARGLRDWSEVLEERPNAVIFGGER